MIDWGTVFLGVIAVATLATAAVQVAVIIGLAQLARRVARLADRVEQEISPLFAHLNAMAQDASRTASLAAAQVERIDQLFTDTARRFDGAIGVAQALVTGPLGKGAALATAFRAIFALMRDRRARRSRSRAEDEDALFI